MTEPAPTCKKPQLLPRMDKAPNFKLNLMPGGFDVIRLWAGALEICRAYSG